MAAQPDRKAATWTRFERLRLARDVLRSESRGIEAVASSLGEAFNDAVDMVRSCSGCLLVCGMGKAGLVGQKLAATFGSLGVRSHFLHPGEAVHGDLGRVGTDDVVLMLSFSGETDEICRLLGPLRDRGIPLIAITGRPESRLGRAARVLLEIGRLEEACSLGLAPTTSTTVMLALGDALAVVVSRLRGFGADDFARNHPAGSLGVRLSRVEELMRPLGECRVADQGRTVREVFVGAGRPGRRTGAVMLTDDQGRLSGVFTDSDLAKLLESRRDEVIDRPVSEVMSRQPVSAELGTTLEDVLPRLAKHKISELPIVDESGCPAGMLDITDLIGLVPARSEHACPQPRGGARDGLGEPASIPFPGDGQNRHSANAEGVPLRLEGQADEG